MNQEEKGDIIAVRFSYIRQKFMNRWFLVTTIFLVSSLSCFAQVPVSQEPMHHNVFENGSVRILDVHIPPGDTSLVHKHSTPSVFIILSKTKTGSQVITEPRGLNLHDGNIWFESFYDQPRIHRVWNSDTTEFHVIDMELLNKQPQQIEDPLHVKPLNLLFDEKAVRGYRFVLPARATLKLPPRKAPIVVIGLTDTHANVMVNQKKFVMKGDFIFLDPGTGVNFVSTASAEQKFAIFELK